MMHDMWNGQWGGYWPMWLFWIAILLLILWVIVWGIRMATRSHADREIAARTGKTALEILEERYARGEIDEEEFQHKKQTLRQG